MNLSVDTLTDKSPLSGAVWKSLLKFEDGLGSRRIIQGLTGSSSAFALVQAWRETRKPLVIVTQDQNSGESLLGDLRFFLKHANLKTVPRFFPSWELLPYEPLSPLNEVSGERLDVLLELLEKPCPFLVVPVEAAMQCVMPRSILKSLSLPVRRGQNSDRELLELCLADNGYQRVKMVEERGEFSSRGDILDLFLPLLRGRGPACAGILLDAHLPRSRNGLELDRTDRRMGLPANCLRELASPRPLPISNRLPWPVRSQAAFLQ